MSENQIKKRKIDNNNEISTDNEDDGNKNNNVTLVFDVVKFLFKYLLAKDLSNSAMVCRLWQDAASTEIEKRNPVIKLCNWKETFENNNSDKHFSNYLTTKPMFGLLFNSAGLPLVDSLGKYLPKNCLTLSINNDGIVLNDKEYEKATGNVLMTYLTDNNDINIEYIVQKSRHFINFDKELNVLNEGSSYGDKAINIDNFFNDSIKRLNNVKCIIHLASRKYCTYSNKLIHPQCFKQYSNVLWGGITTTLTLYEKNNNKHIDTITILLSGSKINSWSIVIHSNINDKNIIEEKLLDMKKSIKLFKHTVGFMYACVGRGEYFYSEKNVESSLFKKVFPNIPLVGCFGDGEFGTTTVGSEINTSKICHQYSTVFMILTYG